MNMRTELMANVIFLMMLLACIAGASFGVARYSKSDPEADRKYSDLEYRIEKVEKAHQGVNANDLKSKVETLEKAFKVIESGHNRNVDILFNHDRLFDNHLECIRDLQRAVRNLTDIEETRQSSIKMLKERTDRLNEACGSLRQRIEVLESHDQWNKVMLCGVTNSVQHALPCHATNTCPPMSSIAIVDTNYIAEVMSRPSEYLREMSDSETQKRTMELSIPPDVDEYDPIPRNRGVIKQRKKEQENKE